MKLDSFIFLIFEKKKKNAKNVEYKRQKRVKLNFAERNEKTKISEQNVFFSKKKFFWTKKIIFWIFAQIQPPIDLQVFISIYPAKCDPLDPYLLGLFFNGGLTGGR